MFFSTRSVQSDLSKHSHRSSQFLLIQKDAVDWKVRLTLYSRVGREGLNVKNMSVYFKQESPEVLVTGPQAQKDGSENSNTSKDVLPETVRLKYHNSK